MSESAEQVSLKDEMGAVYDAQLENDPAREVIPDAEIDGDVTEEEAVAEVEEIAEEVVEDLPEPLTAPQHWPKDRQELFNGATPEIQQAWIDRETEVDRGFNEKSQQFQEIQNTLNRYNQVIDPIRQSLQLQGMDEVQWLGQMAAYQDALNRDPMSVIRSVANQYGVDLSNLGGQSDEFQDPALTALKDELQSVKQQLSQATQTQEQYAQQQAQYEQKQAEKQVIAFKEQTNAEGQLEHPHFAAVQNDIIKLVHGYKAIEVPVPGIHDLYAEAVRSREDLTQADKVEAEAQRMKEAAERAQKAKSGSARPKGSAVDAGANKPQTLKDELSAQYDQMVNQ
ncbi:MAG: hypothetical protein ACPG6R_11945 [Aequoribacter sp.]|uniref:hypothetical protein n=1 Tax=Aequoribacter sp. TaxID=2847771 RepID=UPI003C48A84F